MLPMLKNHLSLALLLLIAPAAFPATATVRQDAEAKADVPEARAVLARYVSAANLGKQMKEVESLHMLGKVSMKAMGIEGRFEKWSMDGKDLVEMELGSLGLSTTGFDGKVAWQADAFMGPRILDPLEALMAAAQVSFDEPLKPERTYESVKSVATETFEGKNCVRLRCVLRPSEGMDAKETLKVRTIDELYDLESGLLVAKETVFPSPMGELPVVSVFEKYEKFDGILLPTRTVERLPTGEVEILITKVEFGVVQADRFTLPKDVAKLAERGSAAGAK